MLYKKICFNIYIDYIYKYNVHAVTSYLHYTHIYILQPHFLLHNKLLITPNTKINSTPKIVLIKGVVFIYAILENRILLEAPKYRKVT